MTMAKYRVRLHLQSLYGGDGFERPHTVTEVKLERTNKKIKVRKDLGVPVEREFDEKQVEEKEVSVATFKRNEDGVPLYRLGGVHGKLWGLLKEVGYDMYETGEQAKKVTTDRVLKAVKIEPAWVELEGPAHVDNWDEFMELDVLPQMLEGRSNSMIETYFDVIPEAHATVEITLPDAYEEKVLEYLDRSQSFSFGNKRRGSVTIVDIENITQERQEAGLDVMKAVGDD